MRGGQSTTCMKVLDLQGFCLHGVPLNAEHPQNLGVQLSLHPATSPRALLLSAQSHCAFVFDVQHFDSLDTAHTAQGLFCPLVKAFCTSGDLQHLILSSDLQ